MQQSLMVILIAVGVIVFLILAMFAMFAKFYRKVEQGHALIINTLRAEPEVTFTGRMVYPIIHKAELMDISVKTIEIDRSGDQGLICADNIRADIKVKFFVRVNKTAEDVLRVAQGIGCARASNHEILEDLFSAKFSEALKTAGKSLDFVDLYQARDRFRDKIIEQIGDDLSGYVLEDAAIDYLEQTPLSKLDSNNILDAQGIKKITQLTATEHVVTNELRRNEEMQIKKKNVETQEAMLELERQQADATARQAREVATVKAREEAETSKIQAEERTRSEMARLQSEQALAVQQENVLREKEVAENNRKRAVVIEQERVTRAQDLEIVAREKEVTLQRIEKDKAVEIQKKAIADVVRERIVVERTVAEQEEAIKEVREVAEADRTRKAIVIGAEAAAEEKVIMEVKTAEAQERKARHKAAEDLVLADARLKVAEREAEAKKRDAEGIEALSAAPGLADAKVQIAAAGAQLARLEAEATGKEKVGRSEAHVIEARSQAEATGMRARFDAEAEGKEKIGNAEAHVRTADAEALAKMGDAEAHNIDVKFNAEARGLKEKFEAMKAMSPETRDHEEYRMRLERAHAETIKGIEAQTAIAKEQAEVLGVALQNAKIDIVGGQGDYFDSFVRALSVGKGIDAAVGKSQTLQVAFKDQLSGERDVVEDVKQILGAAGGSAGELQSLTVSALLAKIATNGTDSQKQALQQLMQTFRK
ncbi:MAG: hypothetical protein KKH21_06960 [Gammaproteobacteria bacterium]|jgi:uncharacterized membrane protein YqiK|nr:hypothetical protein [Gammaproteobacteria bacterium]MBU0826559.1 hypothetical protein [Gammaproteobacteria bacterium]MBU0890615.1 hypothetical protein [Gammaproteobacteria bacterium]MBU1819665.1 hypothetical protein [Gammaproteobacteria bacterium]